jgi:redox-sensing transcriptional repressor
MRYYKIPTESIRRLPIYLRALSIATEQGRKKVSSQELAEILSVKSSQIRKDFSFFGDFGKRGVGYSIEELDRQIRKILRLQCVRKAALVGVGNLGSAVLSYPGFKLYGFDIAAAFDCDKKKIGKKIKRITVDDVSNLSILKKNKIDIGIIAVPENEAQKTAEALVKAGVKGILNFSPCYIEVPRSIKVITIDIATDLARLPYYIPAR